ncbi:hypothetical protein ACTM97_08985 [Oliverpabstia intestinalis]|uniref:hypothetical protein n=1 Tax=Oliverpabstia intestinalis TaxID=2606633 RepID=UPI003F88D9E2
MLVFGIILIFFIIMFLMIYSPVIYQNAVLKRAENTFIQELNRLNDFYEDNLIVVTRRLGEGESQNSDVKFVHAHNNQNFAVNSVLDLIDDLED